MLIPGMTYYIIFKFIPMYGAIISFKDFKMLDGIVGSRWADPLFKHFTYFFNSFYAKQIIGNTLIISFLKLFFCMLPPIVLALIINECRWRRFARVTQTLTYLPHFLSWVIIYGICLALFSQSTGLINQLIVDSGGKAIPFLTSPKYFRIVLIGTEVWRDMGWSSILYLAAIMDIDPTLYEASEIDGCGRLQQIIHITLPSLVGVFMVLLILRLGTILDAGFDQIYVMQTPQVVEVSEIIDTWVFKEGLNKMNYSLASAVGLLKSVFALALVVSTNHLAKKWEYGLW
jgi:putative aldouronate transport system permease protein